MTTLTHNDIAAMSTAAWSYVDQALSDFHAASNHFHRMFRLPDRLGRAKMEAAHAHFLMALAAAKAVTAKWDDLESQELDLDQVPFAFPGE